MAHFLFRPHIHHADRTVATDFLIRECVAQPFETQCGPVFLPVDLLNCAVEMEVCGNAALIAPTIFTFAGDGTLYAAPAVTVLDALVHARDVGLAWTLARVSISRRALPLSENETLLPEFGDEPGTEIPSSQLIGAGRHRAALHAIGQVRTFDLPDQARIAFNRDDTLDHVVSLRPLSMETGQ